MAAQYENPKAEDGIEEPNDRQSYHSHNEGFKTEVIYLKDPTGRKFTFPFSIGRTWHVCFISRCLTIGKINNQ